MDIHLFKANKDSTNELVENTSSLLKNTNISSTSSTTVDGLADEDANLMIKLKFLTYKVFSVQFKVLCTYRTIDNICTMILLYYFCFKFYRRYMYPSNLQLRTFLIRNGLPILFKEGPSAYRTYYLRYDEFLKRCFNFED